MCDIASSVIMARVYDEILNREIEENIKDGFVKGRASLLD
jgi:hypothetical protein